jgi:hypothetical protein
MPAINPMITDDIAPTNPAQGVIATSPATAPDGLHPLDDQPSEHGGRRGDERVDERLRSNEVRTERGPRVEAEPPEPQDAGSQQRERQRVRRHRLARPALTATEQEHERQRTGTRVDVHDGSAREVERAPFGEPAPGEHPVGNRQVDEERPQADEPHPRMPAHAIGDRASNEGGRDDGEGQLKRDERHRRDAAGHAVLQILQPDVVEVADPAAVSGITEREAVTDEDPEHRDDAHREKVLHEHREDVLGAHHAAVEQRKAGCHEENKGGRGKHPRGIAAIEFGHDATPDRRCAMNVRELRVPEDRAALRSRVRRTASRFGCELPAPRTARATRRSRRTPRSRDCRTRVEDAATLRA